MKVCIIGNGLIALTLAKALVNKGIYVDIIPNEKQKKHDKNRTLGISKSNVDFFNKEIQNIDKIQWKINKIKIFAEDYFKDEILNFSNSKKSLFSIFKNHQIYEILDKSLRQNKFFKYRKKLVYKKLIKQNYKLIVNSDFSNELTKKFFYKHTNKDYKSLAHTTIIEHKKNIDNDTAIQIFSKKGPIAFLPISNIKTSVVCSLRGTHDEVYIKNLIKKFNPKYEIIKISEISKYKLYASNLRKYYKDNILAFGDLLHRVHPLAGQGFNMSLRDVRELIFLIEKRINLGFDIDNNICIDFQNKTKNKNFIFSEGINLIYELFNFDSIIKKKYFLKSLSLINNNKLINNFIKKNADEGLRI